MSLTADANAYLRLQASFTDADFAFVQRALGLGGLPTGQLREVARAAFGGAILLTHPRLLQVTDDALAALEVSDAFCYAQQLFFAFHQAGILNIPLVSSLALQATETAHLMGEAHPQLRESGRRIPLEIHIRTESRAERTHFSVRASLVEAAIVVDGSYAR